MSPEALSKMAEVFKAFADGTRLGIIQSLKEGPRTVSELHEELGTSQANISKHLRILHDQSILSREKRGMQVFYAVDDKIVFPLCELICSKLNEEQAEKVKFNFAI